MSEGRGQLPWSAAMLRGWVRTPHRPLLGQVGVVSTRPVGGGQWVDTYKKGAEHQGVELGLGAPRHVWR